jgi:hypothetical protein
MSFDYSAVTSDLLKRLYLDKPYALQKLYIDEYPIQAIIPKKSDCGGSYFEIPVVEASVQSASQDFSVSQAQAVATSSKTKKFLVTYNTRYALARISNMLAAATENDPAAFAQAVTFEVEKAGDTYKFGVEAQLLRNGSGQIAKMTALATYYATLESPAEALFFAPSQVCVFAADESSAIRSTYRTVESIAPTTGIIKFTTSLAADSIGTTDGIFNKGDYASGGDRLCIMGFAGWNPSSVASSGDSHFGIDRYVDPFKLAGITYDATTNTENILDAINNGLATANSNGSKPDLVIIHPLQVGKLLTYLGGRVNYSVLQAKLDDGKLAADVGFEVISFYTPSGKINVMAHPMQQYNRAQGIKIDKFKLLSMGGSPRVLPNMATGGLLTVYNYDTAEARIGAYLNLGCTNTLHNMNVTLV